ncbi:TPA: energy coupling factor transporter S component ThiW [Candidatus Bathyarchaeota archaeon]|nr:energy coupling factor transporter S component ThiW [Candidatus Bathyarchaeota archaeon]
MRRITLSAVLTATAVILSPLYFSVGTTKCFPAQHMINGITGVLLGPWYAAMIALATGIIRNGLGVGTIYAFPGGIPGALVVGILRNYLKNDYAALTEPLGTVLIGATISALLFAPWLGHSSSLSFFWILFAVSSIPGSVLGFTILKALRRTGVIKHIVR